MCTPTLAVQLRPNGVVMVAVTPCGTCATPTPFTLSMIHSAGGEAVIPAASTTSVPLATGDYLVTGVDPALVVAFTHAKVACACGKSSVLAIGVLVKAPVQPVQDVEDVAVRPSSEEDLDVVALQLGTHAALTVLARHHAAEGAPGKGEAAAKGGCGPTSACAKEVKPTRYRATVSTAGTCTCG